MAGVTASDVKALRDATGAGMMDAKKALVEADGDRDAAARILREKGLSKVATLEDRENNQGAIAIATDGSTAAMVQLKSETDFSGKSDDFVELTQRMADKVLADGESAVAELSDELDTLKITKRENIEVGTVVRYEAAEGVGPRHLPAHAGRSGRQRGPARGGRHDSGGRTRDLAAHRLREACRV